MSTVSDNKRIARNSVFLYIRMFFVMCVAFYVSRVVLKALGVVDYGIYNVVGGLSTALVFFSSSLTGTTQRFLNFELGRNSLEKARNIFNISLMIFSAIAVVVLIAGATFGVWFVKTQLNLPEAQRPAAVTVLYATLITLASTFVFSVYESVLIARENMKLYAYLGIIDALLKLGVAFLIMHVPDRLVVYAWLMSGVQILPKLIMALYCRRRYEEVRHRRVWDKKLIKEFMGFSGWYVYGSSVWMVNEQGINIILNIFFGAVINAARGVAGQVNNAISNFSNNFFMAVRPQIVKRYAAGEEKELESLVFSSTRLTWYLFWIFILPIYLRVNYILDLWLVDVPEWSATFVCWTLVYSMVNSLSNPMWTAMSATGHLRKSVLIGSNLFLLAFPLSWLALYAGMAAWVVYPLLCLGRLAFLVNTIRNFEPFSQITLRTYCLRVMVPILRVTAVTTAVSFLIDLAIPANFVGLLIFSILSGLTTLAAIYFTGISAEEKKYADRLLCKLHLKQTTN